ncbi:hypothetical protein C8Q76DRAFT_113595 [Earliella scabrosa]|nr:hypothetical protein C8Q76DRAFT_113595 [Earliella scabrosa]
MNTGVPSESPSVPSDGAIGRISYDPSALSDKAHCHNCRVAQSANLRLMKCAGCSLSLYCGRECQKEAWNKHHKYMCPRSSMARKADTSVPLPEDVFRGSTLHATAFADFTTFRVMHDWTLEAISHAVVHLIHGGRGLETFKEEPFVLHFNFDPVKRKGPAPKRPTPSTSWRLDLKAWWHEPLKDLLARDPSVAKKREDLDLNAYQPGCDADDREYYGERYVGHVFVTFDLGGVPIGLGSQYPVAALHHPDALQSPDACAKLWEFVFVCVAYMNAGIPLRMWQVGTPPTPLPSPSRPVWRKGKKDWGFELLHTQADPWDDRHGRYLEIVKDAPIRTMQHPAQLMLHYYELLG